MAIVYLDVDDEITSAASRIRTSGDDRVVLVVPYGSRLATSRINFRLLAREAEARGRRLAVVAGDAATRALAASAGLPSFASVAEYESAGTTSPPGEAAAGGSEPLALPEIVPTERPARPPRARTGRRSGTAAGADRPGDDAPTAVMPAVGVAAAGAAGTATSARAGTDAVDRAPERRPTGSSGSIPVVHGAGRRGPRLGVGGIVVTAVVALALLASGVAAYLLLPSAQITVTTRPEAVGPVSLEITADPEATAPEPATATVPARRLTFDVAVSDVFPSTGKRVEATEATGEVTFENYDPTSANSVAAGSIVSTEGGVRFQTTTAVRVPAGTFVLPEVVPGRATVAVRAAAAGPEGNVPANAITVIPPGENPTFLRVRNASPTAGGTREEFPRIELADIDAAMVTLAAQLDEEFAAVLEDPNRVPTGLRTFPQTKRLSDPVPTLDAAQLVGQEVPEFTLGLAATGTVVAVDEAPIREVAGATISAVVEDGYRLVEGSIEVAPGEPIVIGELVTYPVSARAEQIRELDATALREQIKGKPIDQARSLLDPYGAVDIRVWPDWVTAIPTIDGRIELTVEAPTEGGGPVPGPSASPPAASQPAASPSSGGAVPSP